MSKERDFNIQEEADEIVTEYVKKKLERKMKAVLALDGEAISCEKLSAILKNTNSWIKWVGVSEKNFEAYRYRAFQGPNGRIQIVQGEEIDSEP